MTNPIRETWTSADGQHRILWGDCLEILPTLDTSEVAAVLADPPYGIGEDGGLKARYRHGDGRTRGIVKHEKLGWDGERPPQIAFDLMLKAAPVIALFGGNYFADMLPPSSGWLYWDKRIGGDFSDGELIYTNRKAGLRSFSMHPFKGLRGGKDRKHPTQKPVALMIWCLSFLPPGLILDPFAGSCTVAVACARTGRRSISIEIEDRYFRIGIERMEREAKRHPLLEPARQVQRSLL